MKGLVDEVNELNELITKYQHYYYVRNEPLISDLEYDKLFDRLLAIEKENPELIRPDSPTRRIGSDLSNELPEVEHAVPVLSLDKGYSYGEIVTWAQKTCKAAQQELSFIVEEKIDGVSIVLYYQNGLLDRAVTRGNGYRGNDVTENIKTIRSLPLRLPENVDVAVRGEIFLPKHRFLEINKQMDVPYANPRNLAAGTIRRKNSRAVARVPLDIFVYEGFFKNGDFRDHARVLETLSRLKFKINPNTGFFSQVPIPHHLLTAFPLWIKGDLKDLENHIIKETRRREQLDYEIDGLVLKVNELNVREQLGYTGHHPRWAIAFKFESPEGLTTIEKIDAQVGRTGRITPVARVKPVLIGGSTVSNVTLHNQDYIDMLEISIGDVVSVSKRGDVIPAVEKVVEKNAEAGGIWKIDTKCPTCKTLLVKQGAHHFCVNRKCPDQIRGRLFFFIGKGQMDIDNLGPETMDRLITAGLVKDIEDIYACDFDRLVEWPGFGSKKIELIKNGIQESKKQPYRRVLAALGIPELGQKVAELVIDAGLCSVDDLLRVADNYDLRSLTNIDGIGEKTARVLVQEFARPELREQIGKLKQAGLRFHAKDGRFSVKTMSDRDISTLVFSGQNWCVTGSFDRFKPRDKAAEIIKQLGGKVAAGVSGKTTHLLMGQNPGSKYEKALQLGTKIVSEDDFLALLRGVND